ncbi:Ribosome biogenesis protein erb1 [Knufia obscura]|uniref:Ribosome biogenesis protein ERB1 n=2 Tax=Knufia TaxID=430999 RepID=A0AAN8I957_9EURO|nr:Ribosome biogenesis protein erb1 [Knufia obscura]KAK5955326.1 Ribosome biogenesis protein erb1 [Knufia fluminis]
MEHSNSRKRKAVTKDVDSEAAAVASGDELEFGQLDGTLRDEDTDAEDSDEGSTSGSSVASGLDVSDDGVTSSISEGDVEGGFQTKEQQHVDITVYGVSGLNGNADAADGEDLDRPNYEIIKDANGNDRYIYPEIDPGDDSDYSVPGDEANTIGDIPLSFYDSFPHIGYNINGKKIMRPATGQALDALLDSIDIPQGYTGLTDPNTGKPLELSKDELELLRKIQTNEATGEGYDPYEPTVEWFTSQVETMPLSAAPEPKRRFVPSKHEQKKVMKLVKAIKEGRILPYRPQKQTEEEEEEAPNYDIWANETPRPDHAMHMPAPKLPPPGFDESYHPPPEYLPDEKEKREWEKADEEDREKEYLPSDHTALRKVPGYGRFVKEKFERCLDLYLAPRVRRTKLNIDPESLLPKLPNPDDLRPFPSHQTTIFRGHDGRVRSVSVDPSGSYLATGGDDGTVRIWSIVDARQIWSVKFGVEDPVNVVRWRPAKEYLVLAIAAGDNVYLAAPQLPEGLTSEIGTASQAMLDAGWGHAVNGASAKSSISWSRPSISQQAKGVVIKITLGHAAKSLSFHPAGNHLVAVCPSTTVPASHAVSIHTLSKHQTQLPFRKRIKGGGTPQVAHFHPTRPVLYVANQRVIRAYDLSKQSLLRIVQPGARWISSFSLHPTSTTISGSDNMIVGSYDRRLLWMDLDLSPRPYKTLRYHDKAIRSVGFHPNINRYPLFADASDDGTIQVFHGLVTSDMMSNATIVPLKVLKGHKVTSGGLGIMDLTWHPTEPWLVSAGADGTARLWAS